MSKLFINIYVKLWSVFVWCINFDKLLKFTYYLYTSNAFRDGNPKLILKVLKKYIEIESNNYRDTVVSNRNVSESTQLLSVLVDIYLKENSDVVLNQIVSVLKDEFIRREERGDGKA